MKNRTRMKSRKKRRRGRGRRGKGTAADSPAVTCSALHPEAVSGAYAAQKQWEATEKTRIGPAMVLVASSGVNGEGLQSMGAERLRSGTDRGQREGLRESETEKKK